MSIVAQKDWKDKFSVSLIRSTAPSTTMSSMEVTMRNCNISNLLYACDLHMECVGGM